MVGRFFFPSYQQQANVEQNNSSPNQTMLLSGPPSCGKTSLLFQFAFNSACDRNSDNPFVVFICNRRKLESNPPFLSQAVDPSSDVFQRIQMKYVENYEGIKKYFAAFHLQETFPSAVVLDDFGDFFSDSNCQERYGNQRGRDLAIVRTLALCTSAIHYASERSNWKSPCKLLLSDTHHGDTPRLLFIYKRWMSSIFTIKGGGVGSFLLKDSSSSASGESGGRKVAKYSIALQYLVLEDITYESAD